MDIDEKIRSEIESIEIPEKLSPENMAAMLKAYNTDNAPVRARRKIQKRNSVVFRTVTAAAACLALTAGFIMYSDKVSDPVADLAGEIEYKDVSRPDSYDDLYNIYTQIYMNGNLPEEEYDAGTDVSSENIADGLSDANLLRTKDGVIYYVNGNHLCKVTDGGVATCANIGSLSPVDMYIEDDRLVLIFENDTASKSFQAFDVPADNAYAPESGSSGLKEKRDGGISNSTRSSVTAKFYDISDGVRFSESFTQSGRYVSSRVFDGNLSIVTDYANYQTEPLSAESDLDGYVPYYELNGERIYTAAADIYVAADASSTEYTVASSYNIKDGTVSVRAVLGSTGKVFCPGDTLYIISAGRRENDKPYTAVSSFSMRNGIEYISSGSVEGKLLKGSLDEKDGCLRLAAVNSMPDGFVCTDIYVLDSNLSVINSAGQLLPGKMVRKVSFAGNYASLYADESIPALVLDLSQYPPEIARDMNASSESYFIEYDEGLILGAGKISDEDGERFALSMFDASSGAAYDSVTFGWNACISSAAAERKRALLTDSENGIIGIPVSSYDESGIHNRYFLYKYTRDNGFDEIGSISYTDTDESGSFRRAVVSGNTIYIISDARIVAARISDMEVIGVFETGE